MSDLWVLTCAPGSRRDEAVRLFDMLETPINRRVLVTTQPDPVEDISGTILYFDSTEINISKWWTLGLDEIASHYKPGDKWDVLVAETDARMTRVDLSIMRRVMRAENCVMAGADWHGILKPGEAFVRTSNRVWIPLGFEADQSRLPGMALLVAGETGIRHDPEIRWWLADDDFEWQHRVNGGTVLVGGTTMQHEGTQGPLSGFRLKAFVEDQVKFYEKWGGLPANGGVPKGMTVQR